MCHGQFDGGLDSNWSEILFKANLRNDSYYWQGMIVIFGNLDFMYGPH